MNDVVDSKNQLICASALLQRAINAASDGKIMWIRNEAFMHNSWSERTESVHRFPQQELPSVSAFLPISCRNILSHRITKNIIQRILFANVTSNLADDHSQFNFPIDFLFENIAGSIN